MQIHQVKVDDIKPYDRNPRHNDHAVEAVAESIKQFGWRVPMVVTSDYIIVTGHTRHKAAQLLGLEEVPCVIADDMTDAQIKAFRLADNRVGELAHWDINKLFEELNEVRLDFDMSDFSFNVSDSFEEFKDVFDPLPDPTQDDEDSDGLEWTEAEGDEERPDYAELTQQKVANILNLAYAQFEGVGDWDIPPIRPEYGVPKVSEWIGFNYAMSEEDPSDKGVHFFVDDYQFERVWNAPDKYVEVLSRFKCVLSPDFSPYGDMPLIAQMWNHYRKHWIARYWQDNGLTVYPTVRASTDPRFFPFFTDGEPEGSVIAFSTMWINESQKEVYDYGVKEYKAIVKRLNPTHVLVYGQDRDFIDAPKTVIESFSQKRFGGADGEGQ